MQLRHLAEAERHIAQAKRHIAQQEQRIVQLDRGGYDTAEARRLLAQFSRAASVGGLTTLPIVVIARVYQSPTALTSATLEEDQNTFSCRTCKVSYITDDHVPITGLRSLNDNAPSQFDAGHFYGNLPF